MKVTIFKNQQGEIISYATGEGASYETKGMIKEIKELNKDDIIKIENQEKEPYMNNGQFTLINKLPHPNFQRRKELKAKIENDTITQPELKEALKLLL